MGVPSPTNKRKADAPISPPQIKRKIQSGTTKNAVASFFTPTSQKPKDRVTWSERGPDDDSPSTLLVGRYEPEKAEDKSRKRYKIAAFDLDSTLIKTSSGKKHAGSASDWQWWASQVPQKLRELYNEGGYRLVILSNQAGLTLHFDAKYKGPKANAQKRVGEFKKKCSAVMTNLDLPVTVYAATEKDIYRKPRTGMWKELCEDYDISEANLDLKNSFFVGDAGGRIASLGKGSDGVVSVAKDFSCSDRNFAHNAGIDFKTPEEYFHGEKPRDFTRTFDLASYSCPDSQANGTSKVLFEKANKQDIVMFCGPPGAGKSTFYWKFLKAQGYERINQDLLKSRDKCVKAAKEHLKTGTSVVIDNTNADLETRAVWVDLARESKLPIRCVYFKTPLVVCEHNDAVRSLNKLDKSLNPEQREGLPKLAFTGYSSRHKSPQVKEGFQDVVEIEFAFRGERQDFDIWAKYWI